jgi:hypothetical protein
MNNIQNAPTPVLIESAFTSNPILGKNRFIDIAHPVQEFGTSLTVGVLAALLYWDWAEDVVRNEFGDVPDPTPEISLLMNKPAGIVLYPPARERGSRMVYPALAGIITLPSIMTLCSNSRGNGSRRILYRDTLGR